MNKLLTFDGGQPVYARDLSFMQEALAETTAMLAKTFGETYILYGTVDETRENITAGAVCIAGQIYEVPESLAGAIGTQKLCYRAVDSDERTFYDGQSHNVYRTYQAYLSDSTDGAVAFIDPKTATKIDYSLNLLVFGSFKSWLQQTSIDITSQIQWKNGFSGTVKYQILNGVKYLLLDIRSTDVRWTEKGLLFTTNSDVLNRFVSPIAVGVTSQRPMLQTLVVRKSTSSGYECAILNYDGEETIYSNPIMELHGIFTANQTF